MAFHGFHDFPWHFKAFHGILWLSMAGRDVEGAIELAGYGTSSLWSLWSWRNGRRK